MKYIRTLLTLLVCTTVVLAGCTSVSDLTGSSDGGADDGAAAGGGSDGSNKNSGSDGAANANIRPLDADWYNSTENGYVFEINDAKNGSGTVTFEPPADPSTTGIPTVTFEGDKTFEQAYAPRAEEMEDPTGLVLYPLAIAGTLVLSIDDEDLAVGYENSTTSGDSTVTTKITGVDSYGGVGCYATEVSIDGERRLETCIVPYTDGAMASGYLPYAAIYDENGELRLEVKLTEIRER